MIRIVASSGNNTSSTLKLLLECGPTNKALVPELTLSVRVSPPLCSENSSAISFEIDVGRNWLIGLVRGCCFLAYVFTLF